MKTMDRSRTFTNRNRTKSAKGNALITVLVFIVLIGGFAAVSISDAVHTLRIANRQVLLEQAHYVAESGIEEAARRLNSESFFGMTPTVFTYQLAPGMTADVVMTPLDSQGRAFSLQSQATVEGITREVRVSRVFRPTYLEYGMYFENWTNLWWIHGRVVDGKVWSGTTQNIHGITLPNGQKYGPIFRDVNETAASSFGGSPQFAAFLSPEIPLDSHEYSDLRFWNDHPEHYHVNTSKPALATIDFPEVAAAANVMNVGVTAIRTDTVPPASMPSHGALILKGPTQMQFDVETISGQDVGVVRVVNKDAFGDTNWHTLYSEALELIVVQQNPSAPSSSDRPGTLQISHKDTPSIVKGNLSVFVDRNVTIYGDVLYDNQQLETSNDKLIIASKRNIYIDRTDTNDMIFQAGLIAAGIDGSLGEIGLKDYNKHGVRGNLYFTGSLVGKKRYPWGTFSGNTFLHGYNLISSVDRRFITNPPPFTPAINTELRFEGWH